MQMQTRRFEFVLEAEQPIAHAEESMGNTSVLMRRKIRLPNGRFVRVPTITADTMRHGLREAAAYAYLDAAGMLGDDSELSEAALRLLFNGGAVSGPSGQSVKLAEYREIVELFPPLSLLGGCAQNRVIPGKLYVDDAVLICREQEHLLPEWVKDWMRTVGVEQLEPARAHVEEVQRVRMDPSLDPGKRRLLAGSSAAQAELRLMASEAASEAEDHAAKAENKSQMMPRRHERLVAGSLFFWRVEAVCHSELDVDTFHVMCAAFLANAKVGGKKGSGHGKLRAITGRNVSVKRPSESAEVIEPGDKLAPRVGALFGAHIAERADRIRKWLQQVKA